MKQLLLLLFVLVMAKAGWSQGFDVPNGNFKYWHFVGMIEDPDNWTTNNDSTFTGVRRDTTSWPGSTAMQLSQNGRAVSALFRPRGRYFVCNYQCYIVGNDTVTLKCITYRKGAAIDSTQQNVLTTQMSPYKTTGNFLQSFPDSVRVIFIGGHNAGNVQRHARLYILRICGGYFLSLATEAVA